jgi:hypothetical protein
MAFAPNSRARLPLVPANGASVTGRQDSLDVTAWPVAPPKGAFDAGLRRRAFPPDAASLLPGALALTGTGLPPARPMRAYVRIRSSFPGITSLRTVGTRITHLASMSDERRVHAVLGFLNDSPQPVKTA